MADSPASSTGDGRGAFFKHFGGTPKDCDWRTPDVLRSVGAVQFNGAQEGEAHQRLKTCLADSLRCDPDFSEPVVDEHYIGIGEGRRRPDVFTYYKGQPVAFELQLARMPVATIIERSAAYRRAGITLVWVTSAHELAALYNQAFRDLYLASGGRIFAVDADSYDRSEATGTFHLRELSLEPCIQHPFAIYNRWRSRMVGPDIILMPESQRHAQGQRAYATALAEKLQVQAPGWTPERSAHPPLLQLPQSWSKRRRRHADRAGVKSASGPIRKMCAAAQAAPHQHSGPAIADQIRASSIMRKGEAGDLGRRRRAFGKLSLRQSLPPQSRRAPSNCRIILENYACRRCWNASCFPHDGER